MKRIAIFGSPGSGKSTLARELLKLTGRPVVHLDQHYFSPGWVIRPTAVFRQELAEVVAADCWITDGNYVAESQEAGRFHRADTLILLDCPRWLCMWRVVRRIVTNYGQIRPDQALGCPERIDWAFLRFVWTYPSKAQRTRQLLLGLSNEKNVYILRGNRAVAHFLQRAANAPSHSPTNARIGVTRPGS